MQIFIWVMLVLLMLEAFGALFMLMTGKISLRTPATLVASVVIDVCMIVWAAVLLS